MIAYGFSGIFLIGLGVGWSWLDLISPGHLADNLETVQISWNSSRLAENP